MNAIDIDIDAEFYPDCTVDLDELIDILTRRRVFNGDITQVNIRFIATRFQNQLAACESALRTRLLTHNIQLEVKQREKPQAPVKELFGGKFGDFSKEELDSMFTDWNEHASS
jgi:hypothetical protein